MEELIADRQVIDRVKVELYLPVALGLRRCSILELPTALPDGVELTLGVDEACKAEYEAVLRETDPARKWPLIISLKQCLQRHFEEKVLRSNSCKALYYWEKHLGLRRYGIPLRPTIHELYLFKNWLDSWRVQRLAEERLQLREQALRAPGGGFTPFPEEFSPDYIREAGKLLGYPECCVEAYCKDRMAGTVVEIRLSNQIQTIRREGKAPDHLPFFVKDFYPCRPDCVKAEGTGRRLYEALKDLSPRLGEIYWHCLERNME